MKKLIYILSIFVFSFFLNTLSYSQTTVSIRLGPSTGEDCLVASNFPDSAFPQHPDLAGLAGTVLGNYYAARSYFRFNLDEIPSNSIIIDAKLSLFANPNPSNNSHDGENKSYIRRVISPWEDNSTSFDHQPDFTHDDEVLLQQSTSPFQDYLNIDVKNIVKKMISDQDHNYGFMLALRLESLYRFINFASGDCADISKRPLLVITYNQPLSVNTEKTGLPDNYSISQNYPNPFNPTTRINFDIPFNGNVSINIYDINGREIKRLVNEYKSAGYYSVDFNAAEFSSGTYFYKITSGDYRETKTMIVVK